MGLILHLESASKNCSVAISENGKLVAVLETERADYSHAELMNPYIQEITSQNNIQLQDLDAVSVSGGPGSYTGLRIGVTTAKTLAYSLNIPLIGLNTLQVEFEAIKDSCDTGIIMLDARRDDVFFGVYRKNEIVELTNFATLEESFLKPYHSGSTIIRSNCPEKIAQLLPPSLPYLNETASFSAQNHIALAYQAYKEKQFEDNAYYAPNYFRAFQSN